MRTIRLKTKGYAAESKIICRRNLKATFESIKQEHGLIFTDSNVFRLYGGEIKKYLGGVPVHVMEAGEAHKNEQTLFALLTVMADAGMRRNSTLIALGGGVVGDIGGLAASLYMRGVNCVQVPTTLLAQVDSSVGGKTAIDFRGVKNLIGAFKQPSKVLVDSAFFATLPLRELRCGLGEIIKHGVLHAPLFEKLWQNKGRLFDLPFLAEIVPENIAFKASIVRQDPNEANLRECLNLGHTTAHALELSGLGLSHGECVALGLLFEARIAKRYCDVDLAFCSRLDELCFSVLGRMPELSQSLEEAAKSALFDKKNISSDKVVVTAPVSAGKYQILELPFAEYAELLGQIRRELC